MNNRLRYYRDLRGLTQEELSELSGVSRDYISKLENNKRNMGTVAMVALCKALKCTPNDIMEVDYE